MRPAVFKIPPAFMGEPLMKSHIGFMVILMVFGTTRIAAMLGSLRMCYRPLPALFCLLGILVLSSCSALQTIPREKQNTLLVTATAFNSLPNQGQGNPNVGAWGDRITPGTNAVAVSADLESLGLTRGTKIRIEGLRNEYVVLDRMPAKWKKRIDIYMGNDVKAARSWGRREVAIHWTVPDGPRP